MNFIHCENSPRDRELIFEDEPVVMFGDDWKMEHIAVEAGIMPSLTQARKNKGWHGDIPPGYTEIVKMKKNGARVFILNKWES